LREVLHSLARWRVREKLGELTPHFSPADRIVEIGSGNGVLCAELRERGFQITALDVSNRSFSEQIRPVVYDGERMPFRDDSFDVGLLVTVLHHTPAPDRILAEARRLARRVVVIEEIYSNVINKYVTYLIDSIFNLEFFGHPRTNRTDAGWREAFERLGFMVIAAKYSRSILFLHRVTYVLERDTREVNAGVGSIQVRRPS
jgi:SAM-dependent methyltransferase